MSIDEDDWTVIAKDSNGKVLKDGALRAPSVQVGDKVLLAKWGGNEIKYNGEEFLILKESELLAIITD